MACLCGIFVDSDLLKILSEELFEIIKKQSSVEEVKKSSVDEVSTVRRRNWCIREDSSDEEEEEEVEIDRSVDDLTAYSVGYHDDTDCEDEKVEDTFWYKMMVKHNNIIFEEPPPPPPPPPPPTPFMLIEQRLASRASRDNDVEDVIDLLMNGPRSFSGRLLSRRAPTV